MSSTRLIVLFLAISGVVLLPLMVGAQVVPPAPGVELPQGYYDRIADDPKAFQFERAWIQKAQRAKKAREAYLRAAKKRGDDPSMVIRKIREELSVSGTTRVPVMMGKFNNTGADPYPVSDLQDKLFDDPSPALTMKLLYDEMSYGALTVEGDVFPWATVSQNDNYYEGLPGCNGLCGSAKTGEFIEELLDLNDPSIDFGLYDNDGPDGNPNSGDDDGFVDFIAVVHPEVGGECGNNNLWSHRWVVTGWPNFFVPYVTNDARSGGGNIMVWDYTMMPALGSGTGCGPSITEIGVYCHEFGHAFGIPDYYDTNGGGSGIGHWGLMGSGNWNDSDNPAHMGAFAKKDLGWVTPTEVGWDPQNYNIPSSEANATVFQLNIFEDKAARRTINPMTGSYSLYIGLTGGQASARNWPGLAGYGNGWDEKIARTFNYDGVSNPVTLTYDYSYHLENNYDFGYAEIDVGGTVTTLATYTGGPGSGTQVIDLTPHLSGGGATDYDIIFHLTSDFAWADDDGSFNSGASGPLKIDEITVVGGGENYYTGFESYEDGWCYDQGGLNPHKEYFLVENRNTTGASFDQHLHDEGLVIWHVEENVEGSTLGNSGGASNTVTRGLMVEEADGLQQVLFTSNRGDAGDVYPGSSSNTTFNDGSTPDSKSHNTASTNVYVQNISAGAPTMTADMRAGRFPPTLSSVTPNTGAIGATVNITDLAGTLFVKGATFFLRDVGNFDYPASTNNEWIGKAKLTGDLNLTGMAGGIYDVVIKNPDGQEAVLPAAFTVTPTVTGIEPTAFQNDALFQNHPNPFNLSTTIRYSVKERSHVTLRIYDSAGRLVRTLVDGVKSPSSTGLSVVWDGANRHGQPVASGVYLYKLTIGDQFTDVKKLTLLK